MRQIEEPLFRAMLRVLRNSAMSSRKRVKSQTPSCSSQTQRFTGGSHLAGGIRFAWWKILGPTNPSFMVLLKTSQGTSCLASCAKSLARTVSPKWKETDQRGVRKDAKQFGDSKKLGPLKWYWSDIEGTIFLGGRMWSW